MNKENKKLIISVSELMKYHQQVVVKTCVFNSGLGKVEYVLQSGFLAYNAYRNDELNLQVVISNDVITGRQCVREIEYSDIKHIEIVQLQGGGASTTLYAKENLGLGNFASGLHVAIPAFTDDDLENPDIVNALKGLDSLLTNFNLKHNMDLESGAFTIEVDVVK